MDNSKNPFSEIKLQNVFTPEKNIIDSDIKPEVIEDKEQVTTESVLETLSTEPVVEIQPPVTTETNDEEDIAAKILEYQPTKEEQAQFANNVNKIVKAQEINHAVSEETEDNPFAKKKAKTDDNTIKAEIDPNKVVVPVGATPYKPEKTNSALDYFEVPLDNIQLSDSGSSMQNFENISKLFGNVNHLGTYQTAAIQSGYSAHMAALKYKDTIALMNTNADNYTYSKRLYETVHSKLIDSSIGKIPYDAFLELTSTNDLEHLLFGIFCQTYPSDNILDVTCGSCGHNNKVSFDRSSLITIQPEKQDDTFKRMNEILTEVTSVQELREKSLVNKLYRVRLDESKIIVEIRVPTLKDNLDLLSVIDPKAVEKLGAELFVMISFIKNIYIPDFAQSEIHKKPMFSKIDEREEIFNVLSKLSSADGQKLEREINKRDTMYEVSYSLREIECASCNSRIKEVPININNLLFMIMELKSQM